MDRPVPPFRVVVNHLTRMRAPHVCVAGITEDGRWHVRPQRRGGRWTRDALVENGGPFAIGEVVEIRAGRWTPSAPEVEDFVVDANDVVRCGRLGDEAFWSVVAASAPSGDVLLPPALERTSRGRVRQHIGQGAASLSCWRPDAAELITVGEATPRLGFVGPDGSELDLAVTDLRLFGSDQTTLRRTARRLVAVRLAQGDPVVLSLGLGRAFRDGGPFHWLQVNNIHFEEYLDDHPVFRSA